MLGRAVLVRIKREGEPFSYHANQLWIYKANKFVKLGRHLATWLLFTHVPACTRIPTIQGTPLGHAINRSAISSYCMPHLLLI